MTDAFWQLGGWTMLHFLWAGMIVALVGGVVHAACRRAAPTVRYALSLATLCLLAAMPLTIATWLAIYSPAILAGRAERTAMTNSTPIRAPGQDGPSIYSSEAPRIVDLTESAGDVVMAGRATSSSSENSLVANPSPNPSLQGRGITAALPSLNTVVPYLPYAWLLGTPLTFALLATGLVGSERLRRRSTLLADGPAFEACERLRTAMRIARRVSVAACEGLAQPVLVGVVRPLILLPASALSGWTPDELEMVMVHELAHVRRWDNLVNLLQRIVESLLFFHPAVWLVSRQVRRDREECCDAIVLSRTCQPQRYAELLVSIASVIPRGQAPRLAAASAMADHPLAGRIRRILKLEDEPMWISRRMLALSIVLPALIAMAVATAGFTAGQADAEEGAASPDSRAVPDTDAPHVDRREAVTPRPETAEPDWEDPAVLKRIFVQSETNPLEKVVYDISKANQYRDQFTDILDGLRLDPFGPRLQFDWTWVEKDQRIEVTAPKQAHAWFRTAIARFEEAAAKAPPAGDGPEELSPLTFRRGKAVAKDNSPDEVKTTKVYPVGDVETVKLQEWMKLIGGDTPVEIKWFDGNLSIVISAPESQHERIARFLHTTRVASARRRGLPMEAEEKLSDGHLQPGDEVKIEVAGAFPEWPINGQFVIEPQGTVALGATYGRVEIAGLTLLEAEKAVTEKLQTILSNPSVQITLVEQEEAAAYLYDGKTFSEWRRLWKNELNPDRRSEAIAAFAAFAQTGYGRAAAEAILDVAGQYDFSVYDETPEGKLKQRILEVLTANTGSRVPATDWLPLLMERLEQDPNKWQPLTSWLLERLRTMNLSGIPDPEIRELLIELAGNRKYAGDPQFDSRYLALALLQPAGAEIPLEDEVVRLTKETLMSDNTDKALGLLRMLRFRHLDQYPEQMGLLMHNDQAIRQQVRRMLPQVPEGVRASLSERLLAILDDEERKKDHLDAVRALGVAAHQFGHGSGRSNEWTDSELFKRVRTRLGEIARGGPDELRPAAMVAMGIDRDEDVDRWLQINADQPQEVREAIEQARDKIEDEAENVMGEASPQAAGAMRGGEGFF